MEWKVVNVPYHRSAVLDSKEFAEDKKELIERAGGTRRLKKLLSKEKLAGRRRRNLTREDNR